MKAHLHKFYSSLQILLLSWRLPGWNMPAHSRLLKWVCWNRFLYILGELTHFKRMKYMFKKWNLVNNFEPDRCSLLASCSSEALPAPACGLSSLPVTGYLRGIECSLSRSSRGTEQPPAEPQAECVFPTLTCDEAQVEWMHKISPQPNGESTPNSQGQACLRCWFFLWFLKHQ